ncbi:MAG: hypothetical protein AAB360_01245 [Patescibacteria group bacterium]
MLRRRWRLTLSTLAIIFGGALAALGQSIAGADQTVISSGVDPVLLAFIVMMAGSILFMVGFFALVIVVTSK